MIIEKEYPERKEELFEDFQNWIKGNIKEPKTKEIKEIINRKDS